MIRAPTLIRSLFSRLRRHRRQHIRRSLLSRAGSCPLVEQPPALNPVWVPLRGGPDAILATDPDQSSPCHCADGHAAGAAVRNGGVILAGFGAFTSGGRPANGPRRFGKAPCVIARTASLIGVVLGPAGSGSPAQHALLRAQHPCPYGKKYGSLGCRPDGC
jgi:hypothetical protein